MKMKMVKIYCEPFIDWFEVIPEKILKISFFIENSKCSGRRKVTEFTITFPPDS